MKSTQCKELKRAIIASYPPFKEIEKLEKSNLTEPEQIALYNLKTRFKKIYKEAKRQYKQTPHNKRSVINIK